MANENFESTTVIPAKPPVDVINSDGMPVDNQSGRSLDAIFSLAEAGKPIADAIKAVNEPKAKETVVEQPEQKTEQKVEPKTDLDSKLDQQLEKKEEEAEITREKLLAETEFKKEEAKKEEKTKVEDKTVDTKVEDKADPDAPTDDELRVLPHDKPKTAKRIQALLKRVEIANNSITETKKQADEKAKKLAELEQELTKVKSADPVVTDDIKKSLDELAMYRRKYQLDSDPEIKNRFDSKSQYAEKSISEILTRNQASAGLLKLIADEGGWTKFTASKTPVAARNPDGTVTQIPAHEAAQNIIENLPFVDRKALESAMMEQIQLDREKRKYFEDESSKATDYFKQQEEQAKKNNEAIKAATQEAQKTIEQFKETLVTQKEWFKQKEVPADATPEQRAEIEDGNRYAKQLTQLLNKNLTVKDIPSMLAVVEDSVAYYAERRTSALLRRENDKLKADLAAANDRFDKFKAAGRSTVKGGSLAGGGSSVATTPEKKRPASLEEAFNLLEAGAKLEAE